MTLKVAGLFAGIGGFELGFERAGCETSLLCDNDPLARIVLTAHFPGVLQVKCISEIEELPTNVDVVCAGFPCQNLSMAGDKTGIEGTKSGVVENLFRLLAANPVPWVVIENVYFMLYLGSGAGMEWVLSRLEELGYAWAYRVVDSRNFELAQRRRRLYIVASRDEDPRDILLAEDADGVDLPAIDPGKPIGFFWTEGRSGHGLTGDGIPPLKAGSGLGIPSPPAALLPNGRVVRPTIAAAEILQGFPEGWTSMASSNGRDVPRWRLIGNAVSVPVAAWIADRIAARSRSRYISDRDPELGDSRPWPKAAHNVDGKRRKSSVSEYPIGSALGRLSPMDTSDWPDLSRRALAGFVSRARASPLKYPNGFLERLEARLGVLAGEPESAPREGARVALVPSADFV